MKLKNLIYKIIITFTNKLHLITYTLNKLYYRISEAVELILRCLEIVHGILYPIEASQWILQVIPQGYLITDSIREAGTTIFSSHTHKVTDYLSFMDISC